MKGSDRKIKNYFFLILTNCNFSEIKFFYTSSIKLILQSFQKAQIIKYNFKNIIIL